MTDGYQQPDSDAPTRPPAFEHDTEAIGGEESPTRASRDSTSIDMSELNTQSAMAPTIKLDGDSRVDSEEAHFAEGASSGSSSDSQQQATVFAPPPSGSSVDDPTMLEPDANTPRSNLDGDLRTVARLPSKRATSGAGLRSSKLDHSGSLQEGGIYAGKYELESEIARGGMGVVYKARQIDLNRVVALKVMLSGGMAGEEERRRFILEAEASARLKHPNIVPVYDIGEVGGNLYFTMDYVEGQPLSKRKTELSREQLLDVMIKVADGVGFAHQRGIIHRDLKPANVMMDAQDTPLIMDFGLAKQVDIVDEEGQPSLRTREGAVMGTPHYMPPEQADGRISEIDVRSDIYALGVILYELWTGQLPFTARSLTELMFKIYEMDPKPPRDIDPTIDWDMEAIILKTLEKQKEARYQTAYELKEDLENVRDGHAVSARHATVLYRVGKWARRKRTPLLVGALIAVMASITLGVLYRQSQAAELDAQRTFEENFEKAEDSYFTMKKRGDELEAKLAKLDADDSGIDERELRVAELTTEANQLTELMTNARGLVKPYLDDDHPEALLLNTGVLAEEDLRQAGWVETLDKLREVHSQLEKASAALAEAKTLADAVESEYGAGQSAAVQGASWPTLAHALQAIEKADHVRDDGSAGASKSEPLFNAKAQQTRQHLFTAVSLSAEAWPEAKRAKSDLDTVGGLRARVEGAANRASRLRMAALMLNRGERLLELLGAPQDGESDAAGRTLRLRAARLAQALLQQGKEADSGNPKLKEASFDANRAYAAELLAMKAYLVFDAELEAKEAYRPMDRRDLLEAKEKAQRNTKALEAILKGHEAKLQANLDEAGLKSMVRSLKKLAVDPALDAELKALRNDLEARAQGKLDEFLREEGQREVSRAIADARKKVADAQGNPDSLADLLAAWKAAQLLCEKQRGLLGDTIANAIVRTCTIAQAKLHYDAALTLERSDPPRALKLAEEAVARFAPLKGDAEVDSQHAAAEDLVTRLQRVSEKPEGMVLIEGRQNVELGSGPRDRNASRRVTIQPFYLAQKEVTCAEYARFLASPQYADAAFWKRQGTTLSKINDWPAGWTSKAPPDGAGNLPITGINWYEARGYASFVGMRLPRDSEWEYAARYHGAETSTFPWGNSFSQGNLRGALRPPGDNESDVTPEGVADMGGNVSEWVVHEVAANGETVRKPAARGASFLYPTRRIANGAHRLIPRPDYRGPQLGLRLAKASQ